MKEFFADPFLCGVVVGALSLTVTIVAVRWFEYKDYQDSMKENLESIDEEYRELTKRRERL